MAISICIQERVIPLLWNANDVAKASNGRKLVRKLDISLRYKKAKVS